MSPGGVVVVLFIAHALDPDRTRRIVVDALLEELEELERELPRRARWIPPRDDDDDEQIDDAAEDMRDARLLGFAHLERDEFGYAVVEHDALKAAWRRAAIAHHPDRLGAGATERAASINAAYGRMLERRGW